MHHTYTKSVAQTSLTASALSAFSAVTLESFRCGSLDTGGTMLTGLTSAGIDQFFTKHAAVTWCALTVKHLRVQEQAGATVLTWHALARVGAAFTWSEDTPVVWNAPQRYTCTVEHSTEVVYLFLACLLSQQHVHSISGTYLLRQIDILP